MAHIQTPRRGMRPRSTRQRSPVWRAQCQGAFGLPSRLSDHARGDPEAADDRRRKDRQEPAEIFIEQRFDRFSIMLEENSDKEKPRATRQKTQQNEKRQTISQKPAGDRHDLEGNWRQTLEENNRPSPLRVKRAQLID